MIELEIKDGVIEFAMEGLSVPAAASTEMLNLLRALSVLIDQIPLVDYSVERVDETNVWLVTATAEDAREYATTVTVTDAVRYTLTSFPAGTAAEVSLFLAFVQTVAALLVPYSIESISITWT